MGTQLENVLTNEYKEGMISFMNAHPECFTEALELAVLSKQPYSWRAAWLLWSCMKENDVRVQEFIDQILETIPTKKDGHQRELIKILSNMDLNDEYEGRLFNICMTLWESINKRPSVRYTAFITQDRYLETLSPGIKNSISRMVKGFEL